MIVTTIRDVSVSVSATEEKQWEVMTNHLFVGTRPIGVQITTVGALASGPNIKTTNHATVKPKTDCETTGDAARFTISEAIWLLVVTERIRAIFVRACVVAT
jgi:hypothetical protein